MLWRKVWSQSAHGLRMQLWNGQELGDTNLHWSSKRLATDLAMQQTTKEEDKLIEVGSADRLARRRLVTDMQAQSSAELTDPNHRDSCHKVLARLAAHWPGLTRFVKVLCIPLDNYATERRQRGPALRSKNYYGAGSLRNDRLATIMFFVLATLRLHALNERKIAVLVSECELGRWR